MLDPACGDGVFLREAARGHRGEVRGVEIDPAACRDARRIPGVRVTRGSFFDSKLGRFDCIVGNPPYIRYQNFKERDEVVRALRAEGLPASGLASAWAPFTLLCSKRLNPGGRMALVLPREALFSNYGRDVLDHLYRSFEKVQVEPLKPFLFEGALVKVVALRCETPSVQAGRKPRSWRSGDLKPAELESYERLLTDTVPLSELAEVRLGIVTGDKRFFAPTREEIRRWKIPERDLVPAVTSPGHLVAPRLTQARLDRLYREGQRVRLLAGSPPAYLREGEQRGVHKRYKCRIRKPWHALNLGKQADAFLGYLVHREPRMSLNRAGAWATNNLHAVTFKPSAPRNLPQAFHNPVTRLAIELIGRVYGGGVLKIEPGDARRIPIPHSIEKKKRGDVRLVAVAAERLANLRSIRERAPAAS